MKRIEKLKNRAPVLFGIGLALLVFIACSNDDGNNGSGINSTELTINDYAQIATGQVTIYDHDGNVVSGIKEGEDFYGQDANYLNGAPMSYTDNGDGTITDDNTGLMWQQVPTSEEFSWQDAKDYCENLEFGGYDDWRMPTLKELYSISDFGSGWPYINTTYFTLASGEITKDEQYWADNYYVGVTVEGGSDAAFGVNHVTGHIKAYAAVAGGTPPPDGGSPGDRGPGGEGPPPTGDPFAKYVRAVRGGTYGANAFVNNGDGTISDTNTNLMWAQDDNGQTYDWENALAYAEGVELAGYSDWRLPNVKELQGIVDYSYSPSATDASKVGPAIDPIFSCAPITNEAGNDDYGYYWTGTSAHFTNGQPYYYAWYVAFGMAVNGEGKDFHGAGGVRFDTKYKGGPLGEGGERYYNYVRLVRDIN